jgi:hypothetical protein
MLNIEGISAHDLKEKCMGSGHRASRDVSTKVYEEQAGILG